MDNGIILLTITATLTSLSTEAIKKTLNISNKTTSLNIIVAVVSVICALLVGFSYIILASVALSPKTIIFIIALSILSWLVACLGYDKVVQLLKQINTANINKYMKEE